jgi:hypothetical protein
MLTRWTCRFGLRIRRLGVRIPPSALTSHRESPGHGIAAARLTADKRLGNVGNGGTLTTDEHAWTRSSARDLGFYPNNLLIRGQRFVSVLPVDAGRVGPARRGSSGIGWDIYGVDM